MKLKVYLLLIASLIFFSCGGLNQRSIKKTEEHCKELAHRLSLENGNSFYLTTTYGIDGYVWSYTKSKIILHKVSKNKSISITERSVEKEMDWSGACPETEVFEFDQCLILDGDIFGYIIKDHENCNQQYPINWQCAKKTNYESSFLKNILQDANQLSIDW